MADLTPEEFQAMNDLLNDKDEGATEFMKDQFPSHDEVPMLEYREPSQPLPKNLDWREYGNEKSVFVNIKLKEIVNFSSSLLVNTRNTHVAYVTAKNELKR